MALGCCNPAEALVTVVFTNESTLLYEFLVIEETLHVRSSNPHDLVHLIMTEVFNRHAAILSEPGLLFTAGTGHVARVAEEQRCTPTDALFATPFVYPPSVGPLKEDVIP